MRRRTRYQPVVPRSNVLWWVLLWLSLAVLAVTLPKVVLGETKYEMPPVSPAGDVAAAEARLIAAGPSPEDLAEAAARAREWMPRWQPPEGILPPAFARPSSPPPAAHRTDISPVRHPAPAAVTIPTLGVDAPVVPVGVDEMTKLMDVPRSASEVAWYSPGPSPGDAGSAVLAAHVDWGGSRGVFHRLGELEPGGRVSVAYVDGTSKQFEVIARRQYSKKELPVDLLFSSQGKPTLTLITCAGRWDRKARSYEDNLVVYAAPVG